MSAPASSEKPDPNELSIVVGSTALAGWEDIEVTRHAEAFPNGFTIRASSSDPISGKALAARGGDACVVKIGDDTVITGYLDRDSESGEAGGHEIELVGRGKTQDLVDCSAEWDSGQILSATVLDIARKLAAPYGISVELANGAAPGDPVPQFNLNYGETGAAIIQRLARNAALLAYEDENGKLLLAAVGTKKAGSGIVYGQNVQRWSVTNAVDARFAVIRCTMNTINVTGDIRGNDDSFFFYDAKDPAIARHRLLYLPLISAADPKNFTEKTANWEASRRAGRGTLVQVTVDSWRDAKGALWTPNTLVDVTVPGLRDQKTLCIASATYRRDNANGTTCDLTLLPPAAFSPQPISLQPVNLNDIQPGDAQ